MPKKRAQETAAATTERPDPARLSQSELATLLPARPPATPADIERAIAAGAPRNADGTLHIVHFTAWLAGQVDS